jgi:hypothetical protein
MLRRCGAPISELKTSTNAGNLRAGARAQDKRIGHCTLQVGSTKARGHKTAGLTLPARTGRVTGEIVQQPLKLNWPGCHSSTERPLG